jgi:FAD/FMN-containing dehydrogenase
VTLLKVDAVRRFPTPTPRGGRRGAGACAAAETTAEIRFDTVSRALYATDASVYTLQPLGVVLPRTRQDLVSIVRICARFGCPLTLRGGGTSQCGQAIGTASSSTRRSISTPCST